MFVLPPSHGVVTTDLSVGGVPGRTGTVIRQTGTVPGRTVQMSRIRVSDPGSSPLVRQQPLSHLPGVTSLAITGRT
jgi:hypothetical protein